MYHIGTAIRTKIVFRKLHTTIITIHIRVPLFLSVFIRFSAFLNLYQQIRQVC